MKVSGKHSLGGPARSIGCLDVPLDLIVAPAPLPLGTPARLVVEIVDVRALRARSRILAPSVVGHGVRSVAGRCVLVAKALADGHGGETSEKRESAHFDLRIG